MFVPEMGFFSTSLWGFWRSACY